MLCFKLKYSFFRRKLIYFADKPTIKRGLFDSYIQSFYTREKLLFNRVVKYTKLVDLTSDYFSENFDKNTLYEIRRAKKDGVQCHVSNDIERFISLYNNFIKMKKINGRLSPKKIKIYGDALTIRVAFISIEEPLVFHTYIYDNSLKRVRLLHSLSNTLVENLTPSKKALIGRANRLLHFEDMIYFKNLKCITYDFGGYAYNTTEKSLIGINNFKDSFGGELVQESNYQSIIFSKCEQIISFLK